MSYKICDALYTLETRDDDNVDIVAEFCIADRQLCSTAFALYYYLTFQCMHIAMIC